MAVRWFASTSTLVTLTLPSYSPASWSMIGATMWHGPHQVAQKSTTTSPLCCSISALNVASVTATGCVSVMTFHSCSDKPIKLRAMAEASARAQIAHIEIAVPSIPTALAFYRDVLGIAPGPPETADGATIVALPFGDVQVEL